MPQNMDFSHGVVICTWLGICLDEDIEYWTLSQSEQQKVIEEARKLLPWFGDSEALWYYAQKGEKSLFHEFGNDPEVIELFERSRLNPLLESEERQHYNELLENYKLDLNKNRLKRSAKTSLRRRIIDRDKGTCRYCGDHAGNQPHVDHIIP